MRSPIRILALAASAALLAGCSSVIDMGTGEDEAPADQSLPASCTGKDPRIAVSLPNLTNPYYVAMKKGFEQGAEANGFSAEVQVAGDDDAAQLSQVQAMLQKQPCALALNPVKSEPAAAIVRAANDAGVPVFTVNISVDDEALKSQGAQIVQYLGADNKAGGATMGEQLLKDVGADEKMDIVYVTEPDEAPVVQRDEGFTSAIEEDENARVVAKVDGNVKADDSLQVAGEALQGHPDTTVIWASTGPATYGALQAVGTRDDVRVYGFCSSEEPLEGAYAGCVAQEPEKYGTKVTEQIRAFVDGDDVEEEILLPLKQFEPGETPAAGEVG
jgi:ribose transport system substrate-binding protein